MGIGAIQSKDLKFRGGNQKQQKSDIQKKDNTIKTDEALKSADEDTKHWVHRVGFESRA